MGSATVSRDKALFSRTLFHLILLFLVIGGAVLLIAMPAFRIGWVYTDWRPFIILLMVAGVGYSFATRRILSRLGKEIRSHHQFVSDASHELRTPLTIMKTHLEIALKHDERKVDRTQVLTDTLQEVDRMQRIVENLLLLSRNYLKMEVEEAPTHTPLGPLLEELVRKLQPYAEEKRLKLVLENRLRRNHEIDVRGDRVKLSEAFLNIIRNAIEYSKPEGGLIFIRAYRVPAVQLVAVQVKDGGIGISEDHLQLIFNRFFQVNKSRALSEGGGSGLGLPISKSIIEHFGGSIEVESELGKGTSVTVLLEREMKLRQKNLVPRQNQLRRRREEQPSRD